VSLWQGRTAIVSGAMIGATAGAGGWIYGASEELASAGRNNEATLVLLCAAGVWLTGGAMWLLWLAGLRLNLLVVTNVLLGASFAFGVLALWIMRSHGVVALAVDSSGKYPEWLAYGAPIVLLAFVGMTWFPPIRRRLQRTKV
jgi:hypothetical protein